MYTNTLWIYISRLIDSLFSFLETRSNQYGWLRTYKLNHLSMGMNYESNLTRIDNKHDLKKDWTQNKNIT